MPPSPTPISSLPCVPPSAAAWRPRLTLPTANIASSAAVTSPVYASSIVAATTANAIAFARTTDQVHHIVYGSATVGVALGGFFPNGTNSFFSKTTT